MKRKKRGDDNEIPFKKQKIVHSDDITHTTQLQNAVEMYDKKCLCYYIARHCKWLDLDKLNEFILSFENETITKSIIHQTHKWLQETNVKDHAFHNVCFPYFKYLQKLEFDHLSINKTFLDIFQSLHKLEILQINSYSIYIDINTLKQSLDKIKCSQIKKLMLWSETYESNEVSRLLTNKLLQIAQNSIETLAIQLSGHKQYIPDLTLLVNSKKLHVLELIVDENNINDILSDKFDLIAILKQYKSLNYIVLNVHNILDYSKDVLLNYKMNINKELLINTAKLIKMCETILLDLKQLHHNDDNKCYGTLDILGVITHDFVQIYDEISNNENKENVNKAAATGTRQLEEFKIGFYGKGDLLKLATSQFMNVGKKISIQLMDPAIVSQMLDLGADVPQIKSCDDFVNYIIREFGIQLFTRQLLTRKEEQYIMIETITDDNEHKLNELFPIYLQKWVAGVNTIATVENKMEQDEADPENDEDEENDEKKKMEQDEDEEDYDYENNEQYERNREQLETETNKLFLTYDINTIRKTIVYTILSEIKLLKDESDPHIFVTNCLGMLKETCELYIEEQELQQMIQKQESDKQKQFQLQMEINRLQMELNRVIRMKEQMESINILKTHFEKIYVFIGKNNIKQTLYFVNKTLFELCANKMYRKYAKHVLQISTNTYLNIESLRVDILKINRWDLYGLSLLNKLKTFSVGMVEYGKYDQITTNDIRNCFSSWNRLIDLNLWHLNDMVGSRYNGNPLNAELTNTLFRTCIKTLETLHVSLYGKDCIYERWVKYSNKRGDYFKYKHFKEDIENKFYCVYPDFSILSNTNECVLKTFSFWTRDENQEIMNSIYNEISQIKTIDTINIQFSTNAEDRWYVDEFKTFALKWKSILTRNGKGSNENELLQFFGQMTFTLLPLEWYNALIKSEEHNWFWCKDGLNLECLCISNPYFDNDEEKNEPLYDFMKLNRFDYVSRLFFRFGAALHVDYRSYGKIALNYEFYTKCGDYRNEVILTQITNDNVDEVQNLLLDYIEKIDEHGKSNFTNEIIPPEFVFDEDSSEPEDARYSDYYD